MLRQMAALKHRQFMSTASAVVVNTTQGAVRVAELVNNPLFGEISPCTEGHIRLRVVKERVRVGVSIQ